MSFDTFYPRRKDWRKGYNKAKAFDRSCRNHGGCDWCRRNQVWFDKKGRIVADEKLREYKNGGGRDNV